MVARRNRFPVIPARRWVQVVFFAIVVVMGVQFSLWAFAHIGGRPPVTSRPGGVEGFLPISALMSLRLLLSGLGVHPVHPAGLAILLGAIVMSAVAAKSFCSLLCPVGALSEWLGRIGRRLMGRTWEPPRWLDIPLRSLKYVLLGLFVWATWVALDVAGTRAFLDSPYNRVADVKMLLFFARISRFSLGVIGVLVVGSMLIRDLWCRYLCPYGALLGIFGRFAPFKITRDPDTCTDCGRCTKVCPARLPVHRLPRVASVECTSCQDCVAVCPVARCLTVQPPRWMRWRPVLRPVGAVVLAAACYVAVVGAFRLAGKWHGAVSEPEYARRLQEIDSPLYTHVGGLAAAEDRSPGPRLETGHVRQ